MLGLEVIMANNVIEGVEKAKEEKPHLILLVIMLPKMNGIEATRKIRSNPETDSIPIVATTVLREELELRSCIEAGCNDFLVKPFSMKQLKRKVRKFIPTSSQTIH